MTAANPPEVETGDSRADEDPEPLTRREVTARRWQLATVAIAVIVLDQLTKAWAVDRLPGDPIEGPWGSSLTLVFNRGSAFSLGEGLGPVFGVLALVVGIGMFWIVRTVRERSLVFGLGLVQGGAIGNVIDRAFRDGDGFLGGAVIDFLKVGDWWPVFNIADAAIVVGGLIVVALGSRA